MKPDVISVLLKENVNSDRLGELLNLTWDDVDLEEQTIKIQEKAFWSPKTYERDIPINETVDRVLRRLREGNKGKFVFTHQGKKIDDNTLRKKLSL